MSGVTSDRTAGVVRLAKAIIKAACQIWLGPVAGIGEEIADLLGVQAESELQRHRALQVFDQCTDAVATRILRANDYFSDLPAGERHAAILAVEETLQSSSMEAARFGIATSLNPGAMLELLEPAKESVLRSAVLSSRA